MKMTQHYRSAASNKIPGLNLCCNFPSMPSQKLEGWKLERPVCMATSKRIDEDCGGVPVVIWNNSMSAGCLSCSTSSHQQNFTLNKMFESILKALDQTHSNTSYTLRQFCQRNAQSRIVQTTQSGAKNWAQRKHVKVLISVCCHRNWLWPNLPCR